MIDIDVKLKNTDEVLARLHPRAYKKALNRTINDIGRKLTTYTTKEVRKRYNIKAQDVKKHMRIRRSRYADMRYQMNVDSERRNISNFGARVLKKKGYMSVKVRKDKGRSTLRNTFLAKNKKAVLHRVGNTQEVKAVQTVSIPQMFNKKILDKASDKSKKEFGTKLSDNLSFYIGKE